MAGSRKGALKAWVTIRKKAKALAKKRSEAAYKAHATRKRMKRLSK
jgi:hypothetical protein